MTIITDALPSGTNTIGATKPAVLTPLGYQQITSLSSAAALTVPAGSTCAEIVVEGASIRWREDGTNPTASVGMPMTVGSSRLHTTSLAAFRAIEQSSGAVLNIHYYG
jgi:hypothetical protein